MMPVRGALRLLAAERALTMCPNRSVTVPRLSRAETLSISATRQMLEGHAAAVAASLITDAEVERLAALQAELAAARPRGDSRRILAANEEFHFLVYDAACIPVLADITAMLWLHSTLTLAFFFRAARKLHEYSETQNRNNLALVASLRQRDAEGARHAIEAEIVAGSRLPDRLMREAKSGEAAVTPRGRRPKPRTGKAGGVAALA